MKIFADKNSEQESGKKAGKNAVQLKDNRPKSVLQKKQVDALASKNDSPIQKKENNTGLPDNLKTGVENLSGHSMDDVKVHYNSAEPAQLNAHAYAQGNQIHVAPGQEKHLPHEAWHVVQQKQGRVKPTKQLKGKTNINDDEGLEKEADVMGMKALSGNVTQTMQYENDNVVNNTVAQRMSLEQFQTVSKQELGEDYGNFLVYFKDDYEAHERMGGFTTDGNMYRNWMDYVKDEAFTKRMLDDYILNFRGISSLTPLSPVEEFEPEIEEPVKRPWQKVAPKGEPKIIGETTTKGKDIDWAYFERQPLFPRALGSLDQPIEEQVHDLDIIQGSLGDCWLLATIGAIAIKSPEDLIRLIQEVTLTGFPSPQRIFKVRLHAGIGALPVDVLVNSQLPIKAGNLIYGGKGKNALDQFSLYLPLIEKATAGFLGRNAGYEALTSSGSRQAFTTLTGKLPKEILIMTLEGDEEKQLELAKNKDKPMTISGKRKNPETLGKETNFEPHEMVVLDTNGNRFTIYDQSARKGYRVIHTTLEEMREPVKSGPYYYEFNKISIAETSTRTYGEGAGLIKDFHIQSEFFLLERMQVLPTVGHLFQQLHDLEHRLSVFKVTTDLDFGVIDEKLTRLETLLASFH